MNSRGSDTYPPCEGLINWVVLRTPLNISSAQVSEVKSHALLFAQSMSCSSLFCSPSKLLLESA